jgi:hypothetical protein
MPYKIASDVEGCSGYAVIKPETGEVVGCHAVKVDAAKHIRALYANVPDAVKKATTESLMILQQKIQAKEVDANSLAVHHYVTTELTQRGLDLTGEELFEKEVIIDPDLILDGIELGELFAGEEELVEDIIVKWEEGEIDFFKVAFGLWGDGLEILVNPTKENLDKVAESDTFTPPVSVSRDAKRALEWIRDGKAGGGFTDVGRARAAQLAGRRPVSLRTLKRMNSFFARHEVDKKAEGFTRGEKDYPSAGRVAWDAWGGDAGQSWVKGILNRVEKSLPYSEPFIKADEKKFTLGPLYIPNVLDAHKEWTDEEELQSAIWEYVRSGDRNIHLQHNREVTAGEWVEIMTFPYELKVPMKKANGGTSEITYPANTVFMGVLWKDWAWDLVKKGKLRGYSIGGKAKRLDADFPIEAEKGDPGVNAVHVDTIMKPPKKIKKAKDIQIGDIVLFATHKDGEATLYSTGQVEGIERSGKVSIRGTNESQEATEDDPVAILRVWAETDSGYQETDRRVVKPFSTLRQTEKDDLSKSTEDALKDKVKEHNAEVEDAKGKRTTLGTLQEVYNRGVGAYNTSPSSVRPNVTGKEQWAFGRVNGFLHALRTGRYKRKPYDTDLLPEEHSLSSKGDK